jgi:hypothetical protein
VGQGGSAAEVGNCSGGQEVLGLEGKCYLEVMVERYIIGFEGRKGARR